MNYDVFISHASEDKNSFVKGLAEGLKGFGLKVWYDEFTLQVGDSLSKSIDKGLVNSKYGVVVLSPYFFEKGWPDYELRGLLSREIDASKIILPIWHNISKNDLLKFSPSLADKFAIDTSKSSLGDICFQLLEVISPEIFESIHRKLLLKAKIENEGKIEYHNFDNVHLGNVKHEGFSPNLLIRIKLIWRMTFDVMPTSLESTIDLFMRDLYPEQEIFIWELICATLLDIELENKYSIQQRQEIFRLILAYTSHEVTEKTLENLSFFTFDEGKRFLETFNNVVPDNFEPKIKRSLTFSEFHELYKLNK